MEGRWYTAGGGRGGGALGLLLFAVVIIAGSGVAAGIAQAVASGAVLVPDYGATWIDERPGLRPKTILIYRSLLRSHIAPHFEDVTVAEVTLARIRRWRKVLLDSGVSEVTTAKAYRLLRAIFNTALDDGADPAQPMPHQGR